MPKPTESGSTRWSEAMASTAAFHNAVRSEEDTEGIAASSKMRPETKDMM